MSYSLTFRRILVCIDRAGLDRVPIALILISICFGLRADDSKSATQGSVEINIKLLPKLPPPTVSLDAQTTAPSDSSTGIADESAAALDSFEVELLPQDDSSNGQECPGGEPPEIGEVLPPQPDDVPLIQDEHPFDAPAARATNREERLKDQSKRDVPNDQFSTQQLDHYQQIEKLLRYFREHPENVARRGPWALMHTILPFGVDTEIIAGKRRVNAIGWLCHNGVSGRQRMFQSTKSGFRPNVGQGVQGHEGQFLAILAQSHVQPDYPLQVGNRKYTIMDLVRYEQATCREKSELTFKLIAFSHYLPPNQTWRDDRGRSWSMEKLVAEELAQPIAGAACGGTHRLMGLSCGVIRRQQAGLPITGHFERAKLFLDDFVGYTFSLQNPDGSFSTEWFEQRADEPDIERKIQTTGHILEWLVYTLPDEQLQRPEISSAVTFLLDNIGENPQNDWPIGPRGHSLRALSLYQQRALQDSKRVQRIAVEFSDAPPIR